MKSDLPFALCGEVIPPVLVVLIYRPPDADVKVRSDPKLFCLLCSTCSKFSNKIIMGDLNADMHFSVLSDSNSDTK